MTKTLEESKKAFSQKLDNHFQQTTSVIQQSAKNTSVETFPKASKQPKGLGGQSSESFSRGR